MQTNSLAGRWPTKHTVSTVLFLLLFIEQVWIFFHRTQTGVYKNTQDIWVDVIFMFFFGVITILFAYKEHLIFLGKWKV